MKLIRKYLKKVLYLGLCLLIVQTLLAIQHGGVNYQVSVPSLSDTFHYFANFSNGTSNSQATQIEVTSLNDSAIKLTAPIILSGKHNGHNGFALAAFVKESCKSIKDKPTGKFFTMLGFVDRRILYCPVEKCATTFWRRTFHLLTYKKSPSPYRNPFAVPLSILPKVNKGFTVQTSYKSSAKENLVRQNSFKFLFIRNPYSRVYSAFVDKLLPPNPYFWKVLGVKSITQFRKNPSTKSRTTGYDVTFAEYVKYVIKSLQTKKDLDAHHIPIFDKCEPCAVEFDYIGKMESFPEDSMYILKKMELNSTVEKFSDSAVYKDMSAEDALIDTTTSPFMWKRDIMKTISWETALRRTWLKLQMRGLVDLDQTFERYVSKDVIGTIRDKEFQAIANEARKKSDPVKLKRQKSEGMREAYLTVHLDDVKLLRSLYKTDLEIFKYEESPPELFDRPSEPQSAEKYLTYYQWT